MNNVSKRAAGAAEELGGKIKGAVGKIDKVHQSERDREPAGEHEQQHAVGNAIEQVGEDCGHRKRVNPGNHVVIPGQRAALNPEAISITSRSRVRAKRAPG